MKFKSNDAIDSIRKYKLSKQNPNLKFKECNTEAQIKTQLMAEAISI